MAALPGFLLVFTAEGKLLYLSESVSEHLGHSMVSAEHPLSLGWDTDETDEPSTSENLRITEEGEVLCVKRFYVSRINSCHLH